MVIFYTKPGSIFHRILKNKKFLATPGDEVLPEIRQYNTKIIVSVNCNLE
jgi:hypothetical protein